MTELKLIEGEYQPGDIIGVFPGSPLSRIGAELEYRLIAPATYLFHFLVIARRCQFEDDYEIYESISKGTATGRLSWYDSDPYIVFRVNDPNVRVLGERAVDYASSFGRCRYDYLLFAKLFAGAVKCWINQITRERRLRRIRFCELPYARDSVFICTELANEVWLHAGRPPIPEHCVYIPAGFIKAMLDRKLDVIGVNRVDRIMKKEAISEAITRRKNTREGGNAVPDLPIYGDKSNPQ